MDNTKHKPPSWFIDNSLIVNTGWSVYDVFDVDQGNPNVVLQDVLQLKKLFPNTSIILHWYVWNNVSNFDIGYPLFNPPKNGFEKAVEIIQTKFNVRQQKNANT
jgi:hypothetical protein